MSRYRSIPSPINRLTHLSHSCLKVSKNCAINNEDHYNGGNDPRGKGWEGTQGTVRTPGDIAVFPDACLPKSKRRSGADKPIGPTAGISHSLV